MSAASVEAQFYHDSQAKGFFSVLIESSQHTYPLRQLPDVLDRLPADADVFLSQGEFFRPNRRLVNLSRLGLCFADLETHKTIYADRTPEQQAQALLLYCEETGLPHPSLINYSGRGLHAKWVFDGPVPGRVLPRWSAVQKALGACLQPFGVDKGARDGSRVLRAVGTRNSRSGQLCRTVWESERGGSVARWPFEALAYELLPFTREELQARKQAKAEKRKALGTQANLWTPQQLWWNRLADVRKLIELRGWTEGVPEGYRTSFLLAATCAVAWGAEPDDLEGEVETLANEFCPSLPLHLARSYMGSAIRAAKAGKPYRFSSQRLIELLDISQDEQRHLRTIIGNDLRVERRRERDRLTKRKNSDRATYEAEAQKKREKAQALRVAGLSYKAIAQHMALTKDAVDKLLRTG